MVDWARNSEDRVVIPKSIFTPVSSKGKYEDNLGFKQRILIKSFNKRLKHVAFSIQSHFYFFLTFASV